MRLAAVALGMLVSCVVPNPAFFATQGGSEGSTSTATGATAGASTFDPTGGATTRDPATGSTTAATVTAGTTGPVDPSTSIAMTATSIGTDATSQTATDATSTGDPDTTDAMGSGTFMPQPDLGTDVCANVVAPDLTLAVHHVPPPQDCGFPTLAFPALVIGKPDADSIQLRQCKEFKDCVDGNVQCLSVQTLTVHIGAPTELVPQFGEGTCLYLQYHGAGLQAGDTCAATLVRLALVGQGHEPVSVFVAGVGIPDTSVLPSPWDKWLEFSVLAAHLDFCGQGPDQVCGQMPGEHRYVVNFGGYEIDVMPHASKAGKVPVYDDNSNAIDERSGVFHNLRSRAFPPDHCDFGWVWLDDVHKAP